METAHGIPRAYERVYARIDLDAILDNMKNMKGHISEQTKMLGVIKTDGYGHGCVPIAQVLEPCDFMFGFAVATAQEAGILRKAGIKKPILILGYSFPSSYEQLIAEDVRIAVFREDSLEALQREALRQKKNCKVHIKVDTGMGRIGIRPDESGEAFVEKLLKCDRLEIEGIFTHFARADEADKTHAEGQLGAFVSFVQKIEKRYGIRIPYKHCSNSAGILELPQANLDLVRAGITMYGLYPSEEVDQTIVPLRPAMSLHSRIVYCKTVRAGECVSYGGTYQAKEERRIATIPVGYGDGYPRSLSGKGSVLIDGRRAPIVGRVCMDQFMVDVTEIPGALEDAPVVLIGGDGAEKITAEELGELSGRFNYELVCDLGKRVPKVYVQGGEVVSCKDYFEDL